MGIDIGKALGGAVDLVSDFIPGGNIISGAAQSILGLGAEKALGYDKASNAANAAASPQVYTIPNILGYSNPMRIPTIDMPTYTGAPLLPNMPTMPSPALQPATTGETGQGRALGQSQAALLSMLEPTSPIMQDLTNQEAQLGRINFIKSLRDVMNMNRRSRIAGRGGLFDNERQDETLSRLLQQNAQETEAGARSKAMDRLSQYSGSMQNLASGYGNYAGTEQTRRNNYLNQLNNYINQLRSDVSTRNQQQRSDVATNVGQQRENVTNLLNILNKVGPATASSGASNAAQGYANNLAIAQPFISALSGGIQTGLQKLF